jgi:adenylate cyclase
VITFGRNGRSQSPECAAEPGAICVSATVRDHIGNKLPLAFDDLGDQRVKNIAQAIRVYRVQTEVPAAPSIAVLPFQNMSGDPEQEYFADGIGRGDHHRAVPHPLALRDRPQFKLYVQTAVDVKRVGRELGVRYVLEGSVRKGGNRVRVTAQLIDAISGAHVWAERYDRDIADIFAVQDEIAANVAGVIEPALAEAEQHRVLRKPPERLDAWEAYQRGLWHFYKYGPEENQTAQTFFRQVIALDPNFAPGHYGYSLALFWDFWLYSTRAITDVLNTNARRSAPRGSARRQGCDGARCACDDGVGGRRMGGGHCRRPNRARAQSEQRLWYGYPRSDVGRRRISRRSNRTVSAGVACQPA